MLARPSDRAVMDGPVVPALPALKALRFLLSPGTDREQDHQENEVIRKEEKDRMRATTKKRLPTLFFAGALSLAVGGVASIARAQVPGAANAGGVGTTLGTGSDRTLPTSVDTASSASAMVTTGPTLNTGIANSKIGVNNNASTATVAGPVTDPQIPPPGDTGMKPNAKDMPLE
jgi:hypothetical protein